MARTINNILKKLYSFFSKDQFVKKKNGNNKDYCKVNFNQNYTEELKNDI